MNEIGNDCAQEYAERSFTTQCAGTMPVTMPALCPNSPILANISNPKVSKSSITVQCHTEYQNGMGGSDTRPIGCLLPDPGCMSSEMAPANSESNLVPLETFHLPMK